MWESYFYFYETISIINIFKQFLIIIIFNDNIYSQKNYCIYLKINYFDYVNKCEETNVKE